METSTKNWDYIFLLKKGDLNGLIAKYYTNQTMVNVVRHCYDENRYSSLSMLHKYLKRVKVLQFNVEDVVINDDTTSFKMLLITKNKFNLIDFTEHTIVNKWIGDKISEHHHSIASH